jgi:hypothetical protein
VSCRYQIFNLTSRAVILSIALSCPQILTATISLGIPDLVAAHHHAAHLLRLVASGRITNNSDDLMCLSFRVGSSRLCNLRSFPTLPTSLVINSQGSALVVSAVSLCKQGTLPAYTFRLVPSLPYFSSSAWLFLATKEEYSYHASS